MYGGSDYHLKAQEKVDFEFQAVCDLRCVGPTSTFTRAINLVATLNVILSATLKSNNLSMHARFFGDIIF